MGVYMSTPNTEIESEDGQTARVVFGAASMQGWRIGQEDAHIAIADYDDNTSLFAVFDGHGGPEVAKYCAHHLPTFIKSLNLYQTNKLNDCLVEAFLEFDKTLVKPEVFNELKILSGTQEDERNSDSDDDFNEAILLREEADLPITEVMARYSHNVIAGNEMSTKSDDNECSGSGLTSSSTSSSSSSKLRLSVPSHLRNEVYGKDNKPISPFLKAKRSSLTEESLNNHLRDELDPDLQVCSSSSSTTTTTPSAIVKSDDNNSAEEEKTISSTESMVCTADDNEAKATTTTITKEPKDISENMKSSNGEIAHNKNGDSVVNSTDSAIDDGNNGIDSSDDKLKNKSSEIDGKDEVVSDSNNCDVKSTSDEPSTTPYKGKGKHKKESPKPMEITTKDDEDSSKKSDKHIYEYFVKDMDESDNVEEDSDDEDDTFMGKDESSDDEEEEEEEGEDEETSEEEEEDEVEGVEPHTVSYEKPGYDSGCTAVVALLRGNQLLVANAGDSRAVVSRNGTAIEMSIDHKPEDDLERDRVEKAGGKVTQDGRVNGGLNLSRAIGDHSYKNNTRLTDREQMITALPDIKTLDLDQSDEFMVIACDGIWNSMTSQQVVEFVRHRINKVDKLSKICDELFRTCLAPNTHGDGTGCDNMTAVIVKFVGQVSKRKLDDDENEVNNHKVDVDSVVKSDEPSAKRVKTTSECLTADSSMDDKRVLSDTVAATNTDDTTSA
ncbi:probable protein phosphatase CG10417 [Oppia nitens]|uniref:probable protein phosphatase CG10417 n=1 Tax=Oppia nitens TaxID=1686743 RepID=UPI0023DA49C3|nr:probable protein phosphatase CG10417 [Oppia nitens]